MPGLGHPYRFKVTTSRTVMTSGRTIKQAKLKAVKKVLKGRSRRGTTVTRLKR